MDECPVRRAQLHRVGIVVRAPPLGEVRSNRCMGRGVARLDEHLAARYTDHMPVYDLYSRRRRQSEREEPDVYQYDTIPDELCIQIELIWKGAIGPSNSESRYSSQTNDLGWEWIRDTLCREIGKRSLAGKTDAKADCLAYMASKKSVDSFLDIVDFSFRYINNQIRNMSASERKNCGVYQDADDAIEELNERFRHYSLGYRFEGNQIVKIDSELIHSEVVLPALLLLGDSRFAGPQEEFLSAHAHYRAGEHKDCVTDALNAFESTMKAICDIRGWEYKKGARASDLIKVLRGRGLLPDYLETSFDQLAATLSSGLPKVRNEEGGHGQGAQPRPTPAYVAAYALHLAAAKIVFLVEAMKSGKK